MAEPGDIMAEKGEDTVTRQEILDAMEALWGPQADNGMLNEEWLDVVWAQIWLHRKRRGIFMSYRDRVNLLNNAFRKNTSAFRAGMDAVRNASWQVWDSASAGDDGTSE